MKTDKQPLDFKKIKNLLMFHDTEKRFLSKCKGIKPLKKISVLDLDSETFATVETEYPFTIVQNESGNEYVISDEGTHYMFHLVTKNESGGRILTLNRTKVIKRS